MSKTFECNFNIKDPYLGLVQKVYYVESTKKPTKTMIDKVSYIIESKLEVHKVYLESMKVSKGTSSYPNDFVFEKDNSLTVNCSFERD